MSRRSEVQFTQFCYWNIWPTLSTSRLVQCDLFIIYCSQSSSISWRISDSQESLPSLLPCITVITVEIPSVCWVPCSRQSDIRHNAFKCLSSPGLHKNCYAGHCQVSIIRKHNLVFSMHEYRPQLPHSLPLEKEIQINVLIVKENFIWQSIFFFCPLPLWGQILKSSRDIETELNLMEPVTNHLQPSQSYVNISLDSS